MILFERVVSMLLWQNKLSTCSNRGKTKKRSLTNTTEMRATANHASEYKVNFTSQLYYRKFAVFSIKE